MKILLAYSDNKIVGKTEFSENLKNLKSDIIRFKDSLKPKENEDFYFDDRLDFKFHIRVFADKRIHDSTITSLLKVTIKSSIPKSNEKFLKPANDTLSVRIYRIYESDEQLSPSNTKGKKLRLKPTQYSIN